MKMLVYNRYTYAFLGFKVIISSIYEVLVRTSSYSMLKSMIFVIFNTNIVAILYILVYILSETILISCSCYHGFGMIIYDTKQQNVGVFL